MKKSLLRPPHKHAEIIKKWADGHHIQWKWPSEHDRYWKDVTNTNHPSFNPNKMFRVKPREFLTGAIYPVIFKNSNGANTAFYKIDTNTFIVIGSQDHFNEDDFTFIGDALPLGFWKD